jgi:hypothetical protein
MSAQLLRLRIIEFLSNAVILGGKYSRLLYFTGRVVKRYITFSRMFIRASASIGFVR